jgi:dolichol-phosphate mannosyltransferase
MNEGRSPRSCLSVVTPAYRERENLPALHARLKEVLDVLDIDWEWIIVDDHSPDDTFATAARLAAIDERVRCVRLARNSGSHVGALCGLADATGDCAVLLAADLQDPPETIPALLEEWRKGAHIVWAVRADRKGETASVLLFSRLYWWLMRTLSELKDLPPAGADFVLIDRRPLSALGQLGERNVSTYMLIAWMGFRQSYVPYVKEARHRGVSGWTFRKRLKLVVDSLVSFSYVPIRFMTLIGLGTGLIGLLYAVVVIFNYFINEPGQGWSSLMVVVLIMGGLQMLMLGILGEYIWRGVDEARRRPRFLIEVSAGRPPTRARATPHRSAGEEPGPQ